MRRIFIGPVLHWLVLLAVLALGWLGGRLRLHVTDFNLFTIVMGSVSVAILLVVLWTSRPGAQVTREPLGDDP